MNPTKVLTFLFCNLFCFLEAKKVKHEVTWHPKVTEKLTAGKIYYHDVKIGEYMDITCPQYDVDEASVMTFVVYNVTKQVFHECGKINEDAKPLLRCNNAKQTPTLTLKFQSFSPNPSGFIFYPDESYYLMSYSNENKAKVSNNKCHNKLRMEISVHPKNHHNHYNHNGNTISTIDRRSQKFLKDNDHQGSSSSMTSSNIFVLVTSLLAYYVITAAFNT